MHGLAESISTRYSLEWMLWEKFGSFDIHSQPHDLIEEFAARIHYSNKWEHEQRKRDAAVAKSKSGKGKRQ